ncbi:MAG: hypothetical protein MRK02_13965 [Candidatus Scalindua sp.]|nr:hypothetical protein [Candidatus Scalindua sp.]
MKCEKIGAVLELTKALSLSVDLWNAQNAYFFIKDKLYRTMQKKSESGDASAKKWVEAFRRLGNNLNIKE